MKVLVTGGAGYIGAHLVKLLLNRGDEVVIVDDLATGSANRVPGVPIEQLDIADSAAVRRVSDLLLHHRVEAVIHFAARKQIAESVERPEWYFQQNIGALSHLLLAMRAAAVTKLVFSSSAAVYGASEGATLREDAATVPVNPYGQSKLVGEWLMENAVRAFGLRGTSLRYFNVAGAGWPELGDTAELNLVPMVFRRLDEGRAPIIFGDDYPTPDGTCVRDYVHVLDVAEAHLAALDGLGDGDARHDVFNVGTGIGSSVREMVDKILDVAQGGLGPEVHARRAGDPAIVVADVSKIRNHLHWQSRLTFTDIVSSAWESHQLLASTR
jgi:UDP-glucose 4-epimerase